MCMIGWFQFVLLDNYENGDDNSNGDDNNGKIDHSNNDDDDGDKYLGAWARDPYHKVTMLKQLP